MSEKTQTLAVAECMEQEIPQKIDLFQLLLLLLSIYVLCAITLELFVKLPAEYVTLLDIIDTIICVIFIYDFFMRLHRAEKKGKFLLYHGIDLIASIPMLHTARFCRFIFVVRIFRLLRAFRSTEVIIHYLYLNRAKGVLITVLSVSLILMIFSSICILDFENDPNSNIKTPEDALWWSFVSLTTVGYGDKYPITFPGRILAIVLVTMGVGLFGTLSGFLANYFIQPVQDKQQSEIELLSHQILAMHTKMDNLEKMLQQNIVQSSNINKS